MNRIQAAIGITLACTLTSLLSACSVAGVSLPAGTNKLSATSSDTANPSATSQSTAAVVQVSAAKQAETTQLGIEVDWHTVGPRQYVVQTADRVFNYVVSLGANSVALTFPIFTNGVHPNQVYAASGSTPSPQALSWVIDEATARGLRVMIRPVIDETNIDDSKGDWRGSIEPPSISTWFASYTKFLQPYAQIAQEDKVSYFVVGTELASLEWQTTQWADLDAALAKIYTGQLEYADNWGNWQQDQSYHPAQLIGLDAYPKLQVPAKATVAELTDAWIAWLHSHSDAVLSTTALIEVGIAATPGAYTNPALWASSSEPLDVAIQNNWFAAACHAAQDVDLPGIYYWEVDSNANPAQAATYNAGSFIGRGDSAIKQCFSGWTS